MLRDLGPHPSYGEAVQLLDGRYGPYVRHGAVNASLPKDVAPADLTLAHALELLAARAARGGPRRRRRASRA